jgi:hypothetical protein
MGETIIEYINSSGIPDFVTGGAIGALIAIGIIFAILLFLAFYLYLAFAWFSIAKKLKHKYPWLAFIPFANWAMIIQLGGFHWAWIFLLLIPIVGWLALLIIIIIAHWRIFEKRKYPGWLSLSLIIPKVGGLLYAIVIGFVAWAERSSSKKESTSKSKTKKTKKKRSKK